MILDFSFVCFFLSRKRNKRNERFKLIPSPSLHLKRRGTKRFGRGRMFWIASLLRSRGIEGVRYIFHPEYPANPDNLDSDFLTIAKVIDHSQGRGDGNVGILPTGFYESFAV